MKIEQINIDNSILVLTAILWTILSMSGNQIIGFIGLAIFYRKISKRIKKPKESEEE